MELQSDHATNCDNRKRKNNNRKIKYNLRQQQHYYKSFWMFLNLWGWLNTVIRPMLTVRDLRAQNNKQPWIHVLWTWYSRASFSANHLSLCFLARLFIDGIIFGDKKVCTIPDMTSLASACWNQFAARLLHQRVRENKQILISIINQVHMEVLHLFLVDKDKLLVVVAE